MSVTNLIVRLLQRGVQLAVEGDQLKVRAPRAVLTAEERDQLGSHKQEILGLLRQYSAEAVTLHPLSHGQRALLFVHQLAPDNPAYNVAIRVRLHGAPDGAALHAAINALVARHPALRTVYPWLGGEPVQLTRAMQAVPLAVADVAAWEPGALMAHLDEEADRPLDLEKGPVLRAHLFGQSNTEALLQIVIHHVAVDFWSLEILLGELAELYRAFHAGREAELLASDAHYPDFVRSQFETLGGARGRQLRAYWHHQLAGDLPGLELPTDRPRPPIQSYAGVSTAATPIEDELARGLRGLAAVQTTTLYTLMLAAFQVLLHRYTQQTDILVGSPMSGRDRPELKGLIGYLVNPIVLRGDLAGDPSFQEFLARFGRTILGALEHLDLPFPVLVDSLQPVRDPSRSPIFQVGFAWDKARLSGAAGPSPGGVIPGDAPDADFDILGFDQRGAQVDLVLTVFEQGQTLALSWRYNTDLFDAGTIARMHGHLVTLLASIVENPLQQLSQLQILPEAECCRLLVEWNQTQTPFPDNACFHQLFEAQARQTPDAIALVFQDRQLTYAELDARANQLARHLQALGVRPGVLVGLCVDRSLELVIGLLGTLKAGGAYVPLDSDYPQERLAFMLDDAQVAVLLSQAHLLAKLPPHAAHVVCLDRDWPQIAQASIERVACAATAGDLAYVIYTSGSTGQPKGTLIAHRGLCNMSEEQVQLFRLGPGDRMLQMASLSFDASTFEICMALRSGATLCLGPRTSLLPGTPLLQFLQDNAITICTVTPSSLAALSPAALPALHTITVAGEACPAELVERWSAGRRFFNLYGPTEATIWTTYAECTDATKRPPIGRPIRNTQLFVLDAQLQPVPIGVPGELYIGGIGLSLGYLNRPELTASRFIAHPFDPAPDARLYKTGDLVRYREDGNVEFLGRIDHQVKLRGFRIELDEIERVLDQHPSVRETVVLLREDTPGHKQLVAYLVAKEESPQLIADLRAYLQQRLPDYMTPASFVLLDSFPQTPNGKLDRKALPQPGSQVVERKMAHAVAPSGQVAQMIAAIWQQVLDVEQVGHYDNFFELGGHSLLIVQVYDRLRAVLDVELAVADLFQYPTVAALADYVALRQNGHEPPDAMSRAMRPPASQASVEAEAIAIIGLAGRFPKARNLDEFWRNLCEGVEGTTFFSDEELLAAGIDPALLADAHYVKANCILEEAEFFDAAFFGFTPRDAALIDPQHRLFLECCHQALETAGYDPDRFGGAVGVYAGSTPNTYLAAHAGKTGALLDSAGMYQAGLGNSQDFLTTRVSYKLNLRGPSVGVQTACSTSLVAVQMACQALRHDECELALAGGVSVIFPQVTGYLYQEGMILSPDGRCRPFDAAAQGTFSGQGVGVVVLKRLSAAVADGDTIYAVIRGCAINNDGANKVGYTAPSIEGQAQVIAQALADAGVEPSSISYIETHGTATPLGDPTEIAALTQAFTTGRQAACALGSVKSNLGHLDAAAGIAGLLKTVMSLVHQQLPPSLHYRQPNPQIDFDHSPFAVNTSLHAWERNGTPLRAGVSSFGIGGTNAHVILEEAPARLPSPSRHPWHLLLLSAKTPTSLETLARDLADYLVRTPTVEMADVAYTLQVGRGQYSHRRAIVCASREAAIDALRGGDPAQAMAGVQEARERQVAFLFPGQGAQYAGMGRELYTVEPTFRAAVDQCAELLLPDLGLDLRTLLYPELGQVEAEKAQTPDRSLQATALAQPALFVVEYALAQWWLNLGIVPAAMLGHSIGEYVAATLAGVFALPDALHLVAARGRLMQQLPAGAMLAVPLAEETLRPRLPERLAVAAVNGPQRCVVAGPEPEVAAFAAELAQEQIATRRLHTSHAFHSPMMEPVLAAFEEEVRKVPRLAPQRAFLSNVSGNWITPVEATDPAYWARHLRSTVRFGPALGVLLAEPEWVLLEVGPGNTLATLTQQNPAKTPQQTVLTTLRHPQQPEQDAVMLMTTLGRLWLAGVRVDWARLGGDEPRRRLPLPTYPFERVCCALDGTSPYRPGQLRPAQRSDLADWFYVPGWTRQLPLRPPTAEAQRAGSQPWLVFVEDCGLGVRLAEQLREAGQAVVTLVAGQQYALQDDAAVLDPQEASHYAALIEELARAGNLPERIIHLWSVTAPDAGMEAVSFAREPEEMHHLGLFSLLHLVHALAGSQTGTSATEILVVSNGAQSVVGDEVIQPSKAALFGLCRVIAQEHPNIRCHNLDIELPSTDAQAAWLAGQVLAEAWLPTRQPVVAYRGRFRWTQTFTPVPLPAEPVQPKLLRDSGVYLITGGLGGVGRHLAGYLAESFRANLVLTGRTALPPRDQWQTWLAMHGDQELLSSRIQAVQALEAKGGQVLVIAADAADEEQMQTVVNTTLARFGQLDGVIHAAGIGLPVAVAQTDPAAYAREWVPKGCGLAVLAHVLAGMPLDFCLLTSSLSVHVGGLGLGAYAAASCYMDAFAQRQNQLGAVPWICVDWDGWQVQRVQLGPDQAPRTEGGMAAREGVETFARILRLELGTHVVISTVDLQTRLARWVLDLPHPIAQSTLPAESSGIQVRQPRPALAAEYIAPGTQLETAIAAVWQELLGIEQIGIHDNFFELGGDSLLMIQLHSRLQGQGHGSLMLETLFQCPTVRTLAMHLSREDETVRSEELQARTQRQRAAFARHRQVMQERRTKV